MWKSFWVSLVFARPPYEKDVGDASRGGLPMCSGPSRLDPTRTVDGELGVCVHCALSQGP